MPPCTRLASDSASRLLVSCLPQRVCEGSCSFVPYPTAFPTYLQPPSPPFRAVQWHRT